MPERYDKMMPRVGRGFYDDYIFSVREAVREESIASLVSEVKSARTDLVTVEFRIRAMASAVRQGYDR